MTAARAVGALVALQLALAGVYLAVEAWRSEPARLDLRPLDEPVAPLRVRRDADEVALPAGPHVVHFWATWCAPCVAELPALLAAAAAAEVPVLAVTDEPWPVVARHFGGDVPPGVARDPAARTAWGVAALPETFFVRGGRVVARAAGAQGWDGEEAAVVLRSLREGR